MQFIFILFIDTAGTKPTVNKQYLSIANYTIFQMIMGTPGSILVNVCIMYMLSQPKTVVSISNIVYSIVYNIVKKIWNNVVLIQLWHLGPSESVNTFLVFYNDDFSIILIVLPALSDTVIPFIPLFSLSPLLSAHHSAHVPAVFNCRVIMKSSLMKNNSGSGTA